MEAWEALPSQVFQVVAKSNWRARAGKGHTLLLDQTTKGTFETQRAQCPLVEAYREHCLSYGVPFVSKPNFS